MTKNKEVEEIGEKREESKEIQVENVDCQSGDEMSEETEELEEGNLEDLSSK